MCNKYTLDTNIIIRDHASITAFDGCSVIIPFTTLEELDHIKGKNLDVSRDARQGIKAINEVVKNASYDEISSTGVDLSAIHKFMSTDSKLFIITNEEAEAMIRSAGKEEKFKSLIESNVPDDKIILVAAATESILVSADVNMKIKAMAMGVEVQDYRHDVVIDDADYMHTGTHELSMDFWKEVESINDLDMSSTQEGKQLFHYIPVNEIKHLLPDNLYVGDYIWDNENGDVLFVYNGIADREMEDGSTEGIEYYCFEDLGKTHSLKQKVWDLKARNIQQAAAINSILNPDIYVTILIGSAGTGKTLITLAASLDLVLETKKYAKIIYTRTQDSQFSDIGFLPGDKTDKMLPWVGGCLDALETLHKHDRDPKGSIEEILERGVLAFEPLNFIRGRSFGDSIIILDEAQNVSSSQMKTILSRGQESSKFIVMGNTGQLDSKYLSANSSGLTYCVEKFKDWEHARIIKLEGIERSPLAEFVESNF